MRNQRGNGASSRVEQRRNKTDRLLNWTIGIVSLLILAVGCIILIAVFNNSSNSQPAAQPAKSQAQASAGSSSSSQGKSESSSADSSQSDSGQVSNDTSSGSNSSSSSQVSDENHQASYDIGTADWNAQVQAISDATGIPVSNMTILWLGNGGSTNSSLARVSPKGAQSSIYVVHLIYQNGKWQADNVKKPG
ncbi:YrrS family protein [Sporolactobacillus pectinivorans]|uniref:YrrS family protein n=1 Tax=Sporolactobacillus pectinivorans TaxID=1591408 RepID=UPI000C256143|nr:YrrS family protein [Sporolactobacillus pectinivorans]